MATARTTASPQQMLQAVVRRPSAGVLLLLVVLCVVMSTVSSSFLTVDNWFNIANQMVFVLLLALGMTIVLIVGGIDLSVGSVMGLSAGVVAWSLNYGFTLATAFAFALLCGAFFGLLNGLMITKLGLPDFIATLAMLGVARGLLFLWTNGIPFLGYMTPTYDVIAGLDRPFGYLTVPIIVAVLAVLVVAAVLRFTPFGRHAYAVGSNVDAARLSGISVARVRILAYVLSGLMAGLAGILLAGRTTTVAPTTGVGYEVQAIAAAVIGGAALAGGRGRAIGAVIGALTLTVTTNAINIAGVSGTWQLVVTGSVLLFAVVLDRVSEMLRERSRHVPPPPVAAHAAATA